MPQSPPATACVLLIDDDDAVRDVTSQVLRQYGYDVLTAHDGLDGLRQFADSGQPVHLVLLDLAMPVMDGYETFRRLRERSARLPVVIFSAYIGRDTREVFAREPAVSLLAKPFGIGNLLATVSQALATATYRPAT